MKENTTSRNEVYVNYKLIFNLYIIILSILPELITNTETPNHKDFMYQDNDWLCNLMIAAEFSTTYRNDAIHNRMFKNTMFKYMLKNRFRTSVM